MKLYDMQTLEELEVPERNIFEGSATSSIWLPTRAKNVLLYGTVLGHLIFWRQEAVQVGVYCLTVLALSDLSKEQVVRRVFGSYTHSQHS